MQNGSELSDTAPFTHSLEYVVFPPPYDLLHLLTNFEYWRREILFEQQFHARRHAALFVNWHCVDIFGIPTRDREKFFVCEPSRWSDYNRSRLLVAPTPTVSSYRSTWALRTERRRLLFCIAVAKLSVFALLQFIRSAVLGAQLTIFMYLRVPRLLLSRVFHFP